MSSPLWVKICANTSLEDARMAVDAGADAVGFVFAPSKRQVTAAQVAAIVAGLPDQVETVGVFSNDDAEEILSIARISGIDTVQLHGGVKLELARALTTRLPGIGVIQTISWQVDGGESTARAVAQALASVSEAPEAFRVLVDSKVGGATGGTGMHFDWANARPVLTRDESLRIIVAGGLTPDNIAEAVRTMRPWGVDVASGVERVAGVKDRAKVEGLIRNARAALA